MPEYITKERAMDCVYEAVKVTDANAQDLYAIRRKIAKEPGIGWVSVKDRMPDGNGKIYEDSLEESGPVLVYGESYYKTSSWGIGTYIRDHKDNTGCWNGVMDDCELWYCNVTHWMPLPAPPEEVNEDA